MLEQGASSWVLTVVISAAVGSSFSILGIVFSSWLKERQDRRRRIWTAKADTLFEIEKICGKIVELSNTYRMADEESEKFSELLKKLRAVRGEIRRHDQLRRKINDFEHFAGITFNNRLNHEGDTRDDFPKVEEAFNQIIKQIDIILLGIA